MPPSLQPAGPKHVIPKTHDGGEEDSSGTISSPSDGQNTVSQLVRFLSEALGPERWMRLLPKPFRRMPSFLLLGLVSDNLKLMGLVLAPPTAEKMPAEEKKPVPKGIASDVSVTTLYEMLSDPKLERVFVIFHADWCEPCQVVKKSDYQQEIEDLNRTRHDLRIVTMDVDTDKDPLADAFWKKVAGRTVLHGDPPRPAIQAEIPLVVAILPASRQYFISHLNDGAEQTPTRLLRWNRLDESIRWKKTLPSLSRLTSSE